MYWYKSWYNFIANPNLMTSIELHVDLYPEKYSEFIQSWQTFIEHVRDEEGLLGFDLNQKDQSCVIILRWENEAYLRSFVTGKWYSFITGAIHVLGKDSSVKYHKSQSKNFTS